MAQIHVAAAIIRGPEGILAAKRADEDIRDRAHLNSNR